MAGWSCGSSHPSSPSPRSSTFAARPSGSIWRSRASASRSARSRRSSGVQLFQRNRRGAALTAAGEALLPEARELLARADQAAALARSTGRGRARPPAAQPDPVADGGIAGAIVAEYRRRYPAVELELSVGNTMLHVEQLLEGDIDVGFVRPPLEQPALEELVLGREPMVCVLPKGHPLARRTTVRPRGPPGRAAGLVAGEPRARRLAGGAPRGLRRAALAPDRPDGARGGADRLGGRRGRGDLLHHARALSQPADPGGRLPPLRLSGADDGYRPRLAPRTTRCPRCSGSGRWPRAPRSARRVGLSPGLTAVHHGAGSAGAAAARGLVDRGFEVLLLEAGGETRIPPSTTRRELTSSGSPTRIGPTRPCRRSTRPTGNSTGPGARSWAGRAASTG